MSATILNRPDWRFDGPLGPTLTLPVPELWCHHTVTEPTADPAADMRKLERIGKQRFGRLSYSWAVHPNGTILQGQDTHVGAHTKGRNSTSMGIACIGNYESDQPTRAMIESLAALLAFIDDSGRGPRRFTGGHRDAPRKEGEGSTACPGRHLHAAIDDINRLAEGKQAMGKDVQTASPVVAASALYDPTNRKIDGWVQFTENGGVYQFVDDGVEDVPVDKIGRVEVRR